MSNEVQVKKLTDIMAQFVGFTAKKLPDDVIAKLQELRDKEDSPMTNVIYDTMFRNQELALKLNRPSCQDTGVLQFWVKCGTKFPLIDNLEALLKDAVMQATVATPLRTRRRADPAAERPRQPECRSRATTPGPLHLRLQHRRRLSSG